MRGGKRRNFSVRFRCECAPSPSVGVGLLYHMLCSALPQLIPESFGNNRKEVQPRMQGVDIKIFVYFLENVKIRRKEKLYLNIIQMSSLVLERKKLTFKSNIKSFCSNECKLIFFHPIHRIYSFLDVSFCRWSTSFQLN